MKQKTKESIEWIKSILNEWFNDKVYSPNEDGLNKCFKNEEKDVWAEPEIKSYKCKFVFDIEPVIDLTEVKEI